METIKDILQTSKLVIYFFISMTVSFMSIVLVSYYLAMILDFIIN